MQRRRDMNRLLILLALLGATGCIDLCDSGCQRQYDDCLDTGRSQEECDAMLANCEASCTEAPAGL